MGSFAPLEASAESEISSTRSRLKRNTRAFWPTNKYVRTAQSIANLSQSILEMEKFAIENRIRPKQCKGPDEKHTFPREHVPSEVSKCLCDLWMHWSLVSSNTPSPRCICFGCIRAAAEEIQKLALRLPEANRSGEEHGSTYESRLSSSLYSRLGKTDYGVSLTAIISEIQKWKYPDYLSTIANQESVESGSGRDETSITARGQSSRPSEVVLSLRSGSNH